MYVGKYLKPQVENHTKIANYENKQNSKPPKFNFSMNWKKNRENMTIIFTLVIREYYLVSKAPEKNIRLGLALYDITYSPVDDKEQGLLPHLIFLTPFLYFYAINLLITDMK